MFQVFCFLLKKTTSLGWRRWEKDKERKGVREADEERRRERERRKSMTEEEGEVTVIKGQRTTKDYNGCAQQTQWRGRGYQGSVGV